MSSELPDIEVNCKSESVVIVTVFTEKLIPDKPNGDTHYAKNGKVDISFFKQSFNLEAEVMVNKKTKKYKLNIVRLPYEIEGYSWQIKKKGEVEIILKKKKEVAPDGTEFYTDWGPIVRTRGLDQYDSSEDEDGNVPDPVPFKSKSEELEKLGFEVERGKNNVFELDAADIKNLNLNL